MCMPHFYRSVGRNERTESVLLSTAAEVQKRKKNIIGAAFIPQSHEKSLDEPHS